MTGLVATFTASKPVTETLSDDDVQQLIDDIATSFDVPNDDVEATGSGVSTKIINFF